MTGPGEPFTSSKVRLEGAGKLALDFQPLLDPALSVLGNLFRCSRVVG